MIEASEKVRKLLFALKNAQPCASSPTIPVVRDDIVIATLKVLTKIDIRDQKIIGLLASWREKNQRWFPSQFRVTIPGTARWAKKLVIEKEDRILFFLLDLHAKPIGHMGLYRFSTNYLSCEIDNVIRGAHIYPGIMTDALKALLGWAHKTLGLNTVTLRLFSDNTSAIKLYARCGFKLSHTIPIWRYKDAHMIWWDEKEIPGVKPKRFFTVMKRKLP
jgi:RimJ/RimL family protein N-acetyltransferase